MAQPNPFTTNNSIREYLENIPKEKAQQIKEDLKYDLKFNEEFRTNIFNLSLLINTVVSDIYHTELMSDIQLKGVPCYQHTKDMINFYLNSQDLINDIANNKSIDKHIIEKKLEIVKEIMARPSLYNGLQSLEEKIDFKQIKI